MKLNSRCHLLSQRGNVPVVFTAFHAEGKVQGREGFAPRTAWQSLGASISTLTTALVAALFLGGCASAARPQVLADTCHHTSTGTPIHLVLANTLPNPRTYIKLGQTVDVVSSYHDNSMRFPSAKPAGAVCEVSEKRRGDGGVSVVYKPLRSGRVTFFSTYTRATKTDMAVMEGRLVVKP
jgi:hypothetical protein